MPHRLRGRKGRKLLSLKYGPQKPIPFGVEKGYGRTRGFCGDESAYQLRVMRPSIHSKEPRASTLKAGGLLAERRDASQQVHTPSTATINFAIRTWHCFILWSRSAGGVSLVRPFRLGSNLRSLRSITVAQPAGNDIRPSALDLDCNAMRCGGAVRRRCDDCREVGLGHLSEAER